MATAFLADACSRRSTSAPTRSGSSWPGPSPTARSRRSTRSATRSAPARACSRPGSIPRPVADRLLSTLRRYAALCRRYDAQVRAVATRAVREAKNREEIVRRARKEAGLDARGGLGQGGGAAHLPRGAPRQARRGRARSASTSAAARPRSRPRSASTPQQLWSIALGAVRLTELFDTRGRSRPKQLEADAQVRRRGDLARRSRRGSPGRRRPRSAARGPSTRSSRSPPRRAPRTPPASSSRRRSRSWWRWARTGAASASTRSGRTSSSPAR